MVISWNGWQEVPGGGITDAGVAVTTLPPRSGGGELCLFSKGRDDRRVYCNVLRLDEQGRPTGWTGWEPIPSSPETNVSPGAGYRGVFLTGVDYRIYYNEVSIQGNYNDRKVGWKGWTEVGGTTDAPVSAYGDMIIAKGVGDKRIYQNARSGGTWSGWKEVDGGGSTDVALTSAYNVLFAKGVDDQRIYANALNDTWTGWKEVPGGGTTDAALYATYHVPSRSILLFANGVGDNGIYVNRLQNDLSDGKWEPVSGTTDASPAATVPNVVLHGDIEAWSHAVHVFAKGVADGRIYHNFALSL